VLMIRAWILSLIREKACVADSFWGMGFVLIAWLAWSMGPEISRSLLAAQPFSVVLLQGILDKALYF